MNIKQPTDFKQLANFLAELNTQKQHHIGYCGENPQEIEQTLREDFSPDTFAVVMLDEEIIGAIGLDIDLEKKCADVWGPFIKISKGEQQIIDAMWQSLVSKYDHIESFDFFINKENNCARQFVQSIGATCTGQHDVLVLKKGDFHEENLMQSIPYEACFYEAFSALHNEAFPNTYYNPNDIINRLNSQNELFILANSDHTIKGYVYIEVDAEHQEASIEFIAISPQFQRQGLGMELLKIAISRIFNVHQIEQIQLCVSKSNDHAMKLYRAVQFETQYELISYSLKRE